MTDSWRLLLQPEPRRGAWNMAVDESILQTCVHAGNLATLRLYAWEPACLSLGYAQRMEDADLPRLQARGWDLVRRPTGGRAVLHVDELTYAVIAPPGEPRLRGSLLDSYRRIAGALVASLRNLGLSAEIEAESATQTARNPNPVCFEVPSTYEITMVGRKLLGSAQSRRKEGILQHGSLPLHGDITRILQVLSYPDEASRERAAMRLKERAANVETLLGKSVSWEQAAQAFMCGFSETLDITFQEDNLTAQEMDQARALEFKKYALPYG